MAGLVCEACGCEFAFNLYKTCYRCDKVICHSCTRLYYKHLDFMPHVRARVRFPFARHEVCFRCYEELEREKEEKRRKEDKEREEEELRKKEEERNPKFKCDLCTAYSNSERSHSWRVPLNFGDCPRCGRTICSGCTRDAPDSYDSFDAEEYFGGICKICYEDLMREKADKWDREFGDSNEGPNPNRREEED